VVEVEPKIAPPGEFTITAPPKSPPWLKMRDVLGAVTVSCRRILTGTVFPTTPVYAAASVTYRYVTSARALPKLIVAQQATASSTLRMERTSVE